MPMGSLLCFVWHLLLHCHLVQSLSLPLSPAAALKVSITVCLFPFSVFLLALPIACHTVQFSVFLCWNVVSLRREPLFYSLLNEPLTRSAMPGTHRSLACFWSECTNVQPGRFLSGGRACCESRGCLLTRRQLEGGSVRAHACQCRFPWAPVTRSGGRGGCALMSTLGSLQAQSSQQLSDGSTDHAFSLHQRTNPGAPQQPPSLVSSSKATWGSPLWFCLYKRLPPSHETSACSRAFASPCTCSVSPRDETKA